MKTILTSILIFISLALFSQDTVTIGTQTWMTKNLNVGTMIPGNTVPSNNGVIEKYCYNNLEANCTKYGGLYSWNEAMQYSTTPGSQGICPSGWHIPTNAEYETLYTFLGGQLDVRSADNSQVLKLGAGSKMKLPDLNYWAGAATWYPVPKTVIMYANNVSGFSGVGAGYRWHSGVFYFMKWNFYMWMSDQVNSTTAYYGGLSYCTGNANFGQLLKTEGVSIRCIKD